MIWLIGSRGMLGTEVELGLKEAGLKHVSSDREVDITDYDELMNFSSDKSISWIVNCSAYTAVDKAEDEPEAAFQINEHGVKNIAKIAKEKNTKLVHVSTDYVFSGEKEGAYVETDETGPKGVYGLSKLRGEEQVRELLTDFFIFRISWFFGIHGNNFVYTMIRLFNERDDVRVVSDQWGSPTCAADVSATILDIIKRDFNRYGIYHFTNAGRTNWYEFAREIYSLARKHGLVSRKVNLVPITTDDYPTRAARPKNSYMSKDKIRESLGITIRPWQEALEELIVQLKGTSNKVIGP